MAAAGFGDLLHCLEKVTARIATSVVREAWSIADSCTVAKNVGPITSS
jgi:hypothetical protein